MKKIIVFLSIFVLCFVINAEELTGFFDFQLGESLEQFQQNEVFEICEEVETTALFCDNDISLCSVFDIYNIDYKLFKLSLLLDYDKNEKNKKIIKIKDNNQTSKIPLYPELNPEKNDLRFQLWNRFMYAGTEVNEIYFIFVNNQLVSIKMTCFKREREKIIRYNEQSGYVFKNHEYIHKLLKDDLLLGGFSHLLNNDRSEGFDFLRDTVSEKYNLDYLKTQSLFFDKSTIYGYRYASKDLKKSLYFCFTYDKTFLGKIDNEAIQLIDDEKIKNAITESKRLKEDQENQKQNNAKQNLLNQI